MESLTPLSFFHHHQGQHSLLGTLLSSPSHAFLALLLRHKTLKKHHMNDLPQKPADSLFHYSLKPILSKKQSVFSGCLLNIILDVFKACGKTATYHPGILTRLSLSQSLILFSLMLPKFLASCIFNTPRFLCFSCLCSAPFPKVYSCIIFFCHFHHIN